MATNGDIRLKTRFFIIPKTLYGSKRWGFQKVHQRFWQDYVNYDSFEFDCWDNYCWGDQIERLI